ncbi:MAG: lysophospholipid acyltransferase family protein [Bacillota bacterium]
MKNINLYPFFCGVFAIYFKIMFKVEVIGKENVPSEGGIVLCANHISNYDPIMIGVPLRHKRQVRFIAKKELFQSKFGNFLFNSIGAFPVDRQAKMDMKAFKQAVKILKDGEILGIFAEGTRVKEGEEQTAKAGVSMFAVKGGAVVLPVAISGTYKFRSKITVRFGEPMECNEYREGKITTEKMEAMTGVIMAKINEMKVIS